MSYLFGSIIKRELDDCIDILYREAYIIETLTPDELELVAIRADILSGLLDDCQAIELGLY